MVALALGLAGCGGAESPPPPPRPFTAVLSPPRGPAAPARPARRYLTAELTRPTRLFARRGGGGVLRRLRPRTEFGSRTSLGVLGERAGWLEVVTPRLPNHRHGWIRAAAVRVHGTDYDIRVDRSAHSAALRHAGHVVVRFPVAVGRPGNETPLGRFAVTDKLRPVDGTSPYGCCALALSGHQTRLEPGWPGGDRLAIHGTPATWSIGQAVSLGCMRAPEKALRELMRRVPLGTPVVIGA